MLSVHRINLLINSKCANAILSKLNILIYKIKTQNKDYVKHHSCVLLNLVEMGYFYHKTQVIKIMAK